MEEINESERNQMEILRNSFRVIQNSYNDVWNDVPNAWAAAQPRIERLDPRPIITGTAGEIPNPNLEYQFYIPRISGELLHVTSGVMEPTFLATGISGPEWVNTSSYTTWVDFGTEEKLKKKQKEEYNIFNKLTITK